MTRKRIVCWFSCGAASAVATKLALGMRWADDREIVIARCIVQEEHPDNERFAADCQEWFGQPIINLINAKYDGSIHEVFRQRKYISGRRGAPCTIELKRKVREQWQRPDDRHVFGYCADPEERERWDRFLDANNVDAFAPCLEDNITHAETLLIVQRAGIELPVMYKLGYTHNNCRGCCKSTSAGYWNKIRVDFPEEFNKMATASRLLGARMIKLRGQRISLDELQPNEGKYGEEPETQCGPWCEMANDEIEAGGQ